MIIICCILLSRLQLFSRNTEFIPDYGIKNPDYLPLPRNQKTKANCFIFASISSIAVGYATLTGTRHHLSAEQISSNIYNFFKNYENIENDTLINICKESVNPTSEFGSCLCSLTYIKYNGIMTEYDYPYYEGISENKYNPKYVLPINVSKLTNFLVVEYNNQYLYQEQIFEDNYLVQYIGTKNEILAYAHESIVKRLSEKVIVPVISSICAEIVQQHEIFDTYIENCAINHNVIITAVGHFPGDKDIYYEIANSHGKMAGDEGKFYIKVFDDATKEFWNNGNILTSNFHFNISHNPLLPYTLSKIKTDCNTCDENTDFQKKDGDKMKIIYIVHIVIIVIIAIRIILIFISVFTNGKSDATTSILELPI